MDTRIALAGRTPDVYGALMRGYQGAMVRQQDQQQQQDRTAYIGALSQRYANDPTAGVLARTQEGQKMLQLEQDQAQLMQEQQEKAGPVMYEVARQLSQIPAEERQAAANHVFKVMASTNPVVARAMVEQFTDLSDDGVNGALMGFKAFAPQGSAKVQELKYLAEQGGMTPEEVARAARIQAGLEARPEPAATTDRPIGQPRPNEFGEMIQTVQRPDGQIVDVPLGSKQFQPTSPFVEQEINAASQSFYDASSQAESAERMASEFEGRFSNAPAGVTGRTEQAVREFFGTQDDLAMLRTEMRGFINKETVAALPPGPATDRDIQIMRSGFPDDFTNPKQMATFLAARARIKRGIAEYSRFKAAYLSENKSGRGMLDAWHKHLRENPMDATGDAPEGVDPELWAIMTPEERAKWNKK